MRSDVKELMQRLTTKGIKTGDLVITFEIHRVGRIFSEGERFFKGKRDEWEVFDFTPRGRQQPGHHIMRAGYGQQGIAKLRKSPDLIKVLEAAIERMEDVSEYLPVEKRAVGVSQATHVRHLAGHLFQHAKIARAALAKAKEAV